MNRRRIVVAIELDDDPGAGRIPGWNDAEIVGYLQTATAELIDHLDPKVSRLVPSALVAEVLSRGLDVMPTSTANACQTVSTLLDEAVDRLVIEDSPADAARLAAISVLVREAGARA